MKIRVSLISALMVISSIFAGKSIRDINKRGQTLSGGTSKYLGGHHTLANATTTSPSTSATEYPSIEPTTSYPQTDFPTSIEPTTCIPSTESPTSIQPTTTAPHTRYPQPTISFNPTREPTLNPQTSTPITASLIPTEKRKGKQMNTTLVAVVASVGSLFALFVAYLSYRRYKFFSRPARAQFAHPGQGYYIDFIASISVIFVVLIRGGYHTL